MFSGFFVGSAQQQNELHYTPHARRPRRPSPPQTAWVHGIDVDGALETVQEFCAHRSKNRWTVLRVNRMRVRDGELAVERQRHHRLGEGFRRDARAPHAASPSIRADEAGIHHHCDRSSTDDVAVIWCRGSMSLTTVLVRAWLAVGTCGGFNPHARICVCSTGVSACTRCGADFCGQQPCFAPTATTGQTSCVHLPAAAPRTRRNMSVHPVMTLDAGATNRACSLHTRADCHCVSSLKEEVRGIKRGCMSGDPN